MLVRQLDKNYRADITFFRNTTEEFTCGNEVAQALNLADYSLIIDIYNPTDEEKIAIFSKTAHKVNDYKGKFTFTKNDTANDYETLTESKYTYEIVWKDVKGNRILQQQGVLNINDIDSND